MGIKAEATIRSTEEAQNGHVYNEMVADPAFVALLTTLAALWGLGSVVVAATLIVTNTADNFEGNTTEELVKIRRGILRDGLNQCSRRKRINP